MTPVLWYVLALATFGGLGCWLGVGLLARRLVYRHAERYARSVTKAVDQIVLDSLYEQPRERAREVVR
jgi:hypothetical protein